MGGTNAKLQALHRAIAEDDAEAVSECLDGALVNSRGKEGRNALHMAVCHGSLNVLKVILENELLDVSMTTISRETPLILSAHHMKEEVATQLMASIPSDQLLLGAVDSRGWQAMHYAAQHGMVRLVTALLECGADIEAQDKLKLTPLMIACQSGHSEVVKVLLKRGAQAGSMDLAHMTALHHACIANAGGCVELLLAQPAIVLDTMDLNHCTALLYCLKNNNRDLEKLLVSHGASLTAALDSGFSDLCYHTIQENHSS